MFAVSLSCVLFFFKQKTAYEMRISDWSSDVCSSALLGMGGGTGAMMTVRGTANLLTRMTAVLAGCFMATSIILAILSGGGTAPRSIVEEVPTSTETPAQQGGQTVPTGN